MATKQAIPEQVTIPAMKLRDVTIILRGTSPLISHKWSEKAKEMMLGKQMKKARTAKEAKDPHQDFLDSLYTMPDGDGYGFPAVAFKSAAVDACSFVDDLTKVKARGAFHILGDLVKIEGEPTSREDMVRIGMGTADIRYRGEFKTWMAKIRIRYNESAFSLEQIVNLFNIGGFAVGVGEWRPQTNGSFGMFEVEAA